MYLLDTNICIYIINKRPEQVVKRIKKFKPNQIKLSSISLGELEYGVSKSKQREKNRNALMDFVSGKKSGNSPASSLTCLSTRFWSNSFLRSLCLRCNLAKNAKASGVNISAYSGVNLPLIWIPSGV